MAGLTPHRGLGPFAVVLLSLIFGIIGGGVGGYFVASTRAPQETQPTVINAQPAAGTSIPTTTIQVSTEKDAIVSAATRVKPSAVKITGQREPPRNWMELVMSGGVVSGIGSGVIFDYEGRKLVLTNTHVIADFTRLTLKLTDGTELIARPLGRMLSEDLAVLEILDAPDNLTAAPLGDSDKLQPGEWVIAVGNPFNFEHTVTVGVVSAVGLRQFGNQSRRVIQTDAAINAGNSGGPLVDLAGNVVGINYMIYDPKSGSRGAIATNVGIGFAIPINHAKELLYFLVHRGPYVGLTQVMPNSPAFAKYFEISTDKGMVIFGIYDQSPAREAGLRVRDVILAVDGQPVEGPDDLQKLIFKHKIGDTIRFTVQRGARELDVDVVAGTAPEDIYF